jgi:hypothetical protein
MVVLPFGEAGWRQTRRRPLLAWKRTLDGHAAQRREAFSACRKCGFTATRQKFLHRTNFHLQRLQSEQPAAKNRKKHLFS